MKIAVISPNRQHLDGVGAVLQARSHTALLYEGGKSRMREVAERDQPDLMIVDGMCCDPHELVQVEHVTAHHPQIAVVLLCSSHTPEFLINSMRAGVREVLPSPAPPEALQAALERVESKLARAQAPRRAKVLAFIPCKGGSGATFLATNLGWQLAESSSVLLVDLNLQFGDALSFVHDGQAASTLANVAKDISRLDASLLAASTVKVAPNYSILAAPEDLSQAMEIKPEHVDAVLALAASQYDFVIVDVGRSLDTLAIKALDRAWRIFAVMQSGLPDVRNAGKLLEAFKALGYPPDKTELIVNRALGAFYDGNTSRFPALHDVAAFAVATRGNSQTSCPIPIALRPKTPGAPPPNFGYARGEWITLLMAPGSVPAGYIGWANLDGSSSASETERELTEGNCGTRVGDSLGTPGVQASVADIWNARFGLYRGSGSPAVMHPDFTGYSYTTHNWPSGSNAYDGPTPAGADPTADDFLAKRLAFASCADTGTQMNGPSGCATIIDRTVNSFNLIATPGPTATDGHARYGANRRIAIVPVTNAYPGSVEDYACMLLLQPISLPPADIQLEFIGAASEPGSPCATSGLPGGTAGPLVPVLVR